MYNNYSEIMTNYNNYFTSINNSKNIANKIQTKYNLLNNCNDNDKNDFHDIKTYIDDYNDLKNICPKTFYKKIVYKINDKQIYYLNQGVQLDGGTYSKQYMNAKNKYLIYRNKINQVK